VTCFEREALFKATIQPASKMHIKVVLKDMSSVIIAEAAAISLAAKVLNALQVHEAYILSDNIVLLQYLGEQDRIHPLIGE
jgi:hypothetical protein